MGNPPFAEWAAQHTAVRLATFADAAAQAELVVNATSGGASLAVLARRAPGNLAGKVLIDIANPLDFSRASRPPCSSRTPTLSASRSSAPSPRPGSSRRSTP